MASKFDKERNSKNPLDYITDEIKSHFTLSPTNDSEILKLILKLSDKKASGYDSISNMILKNMSELV